MTPPAMKISATTEEAAIPTWEPRPFMAITLVIVDDHAGFRALARTMLSAEGFEITGEAADGETAVLAVRALTPEAVLLDVQLPGADGFEVARRLAALDDAPRVVLTSSREASDYGRRLADVPIQGVLPKHKLSGAALAALLAPS